MSAYYDDVILLVSMVEWFAPRRLWTTEYIILSAAGGK